jgi:primosomal protein N' (replication factor Y)
VVVIATGSFSLLPRSDIDTVVIERENGRGWMREKAPYVDLRRALETIARAQRQTVYLADSLLSAETLHRLDEHEIGEASPFKWRSLSDARDILVDMRKKPDGAGAGAAGGGSDDSAPRFRVLSPELEELIQINRDNNSHLFVLAIRRGNSPTTVCGDCGALVTCANCSAPVVLHTSKESGKNFFMCHKCGERRNANENCRVCGSWKLTPLGIGIERVHEEIAARFPGLDIFRIDADTTKTDKQIAEVMQKFRARPGSVLVGTEMALAHLSGVAGMVDHAAVASLDSLFALPDFRIEEKIMYLLVRLRAMASRTFLVQTRRPDEKAFVFGLKGVLSDFYRATLADRKAFVYPPFAVLIKITLEGKKDAIAEEMAEVQRRLEPHEIDIFPAFTATVRGKSVIHGLIKVEAHRWPDSDLAGKLRTLPPHATVKINPESLL